MQPLPTFGCTAMYDALDDRRQEKGMGWYELADMDLTMRVTQWLGRPAAAFIHPADW
jgi:hypothetical protein